MPRAKKVDADLQTIADKVPDAGPELKYNAEDMQKLDQFAIGLLRDGTGSLLHDDVAFQRRVRDAYLRAEVMLTVRKEIAALTA